MPKKNKETNIVEDVFGFGANILNAGAGIIGGTAKVINRIARKTVEVEDVIELLDTINIYESQYTTEKNIEKIVSECLDDTYMVHRQYNIGGFLALKIDIDIEESVGIEIKLAKELTATNIERLLGQILYYSRRKYQEKLIVLIVGTAKEANSRIIEELEDIVEEQAKFYYLKVKQKKIKTSKQ